MCITKSDSYYKMRQKTVIAKYVRYYKSDRLLLESESIITNCDRYCRVTHNSCHYSYYGL